MFSLYVNRREYYADLVQKEFSNNIISTYISSPFIIIKMGRIDVVISADILQLKIISDNRIRNNTFFTEKDNFFTIKDAIKSKLGIGDQLK